MSDWTRRLFAVATVSLLAACGGNDDDPHPPVPNIVQAAQADPRFSILVEAVVAADLASALSAPGPLTVFAPTNDAFAALLAELGVTKAQLLADKPLLTAVLQYHVLGSRVTAAQVPLGKAISPLAGGVFKVDNVAGALIVNDGRNRKSTITATDINVANGVIHVLDKVLLPANKNIVETAQALPQFSILVEAVLAANLQGALSGTGPLTVFAPTNDAFALLLSELNVTKDALLANTPLLTQVLTYHVVNGRVLKADVPVGPAITTLETGSFTVDSTLAITDERGRKAGIAATDVLTSNGVIHVIDRVILPAP
ncbi:MAG: fasciclin domain-containing protein [Rubrivivax sp.]|nr:fasciclin domain-containing protein [Rubrivivax sp.]